MRRAESSTAPILLLAKKFFRDARQRFGPEQCRTATDAERMRWAGRIFWLLAFAAVESFWLRVERKKPLPLSTLNSQLSTAASFLPAFTLDQIEDWLAGVITPPWEVVSSYSSATAPDSHGISRADPLT